jgi:hypothetical protein
VPRRIIREGAYGAYVARHCFRETLYSFHIKFMQHAGTVLDACGWIYEYFKLTTSRQHIKW